MTPDPESPLARLRRLEAEERAARAASSGGTPRSPSKAKVGSGQGESGASGAPARHRGVTAAVTTAIVFAVTKGKLLLGALKFGSLLQTFSTLALSAAIYARYYGLKLAVGFVLLILVHEYGHGIAAKIMGLRVGAPIFIPFFGAVIALKDQPRTTWVDAVVGFGGPFAGMVGGACVLATGLILGATHWGELLVVLAWMTFTINLFNLMPVFGLDGDRVSQPFRPWYWIPGGFVLLALGIATIHATGHIHPAVLLTLILGAVKGARLAWVAHRNRSAPPSPNLLTQVTHRERYVEESTVTPRQRAAAAWGYFGLVATLCLLMLWSQQLARPVGE